MTNIKHTCLELFAGCGGLGYGFDKAKFNIVCCNELESSIADTYKTNYPTTNVIIGDITKKNIKTEIYKNFDDIKCDVIIGGPPCVAYSMAGLRNSRDPRGQLFKDYVEIVNKLKPKIFVMENVKGILTIMHDKPKLNDEEKKIANKYYKLEEVKLDLLSKKKILSANKDKEKKISKDANDAGDTNGEGDTDKGSRDFYLKEFEEIKDKITKNNQKIKRMTKDIPRFRMNVCDIIEETFNKIGYNIEKKLLNSADYGVPQKRQRVIFIGVKKGLDIKINFPTITHNEDGVDDMSKWKTVFETIDDLKDLKEDVPKLQHIYTKHSDSFKEKIKNTPVGKSVNPKYTEAFFRCDPNKPSNTVKENHGGVFVHYEKDRVMTPRELARLQSFPDTFKFEGSKSNILKQIGNAVPCGLSIAIAKEIKKMLEKK
jgi:site-specific DNA-cytosine methylase